MRVIYDKTAITSSHPITIHRKDIPHTVHGNFFEYGTTAMSAATVLLQGNSVNNQMHTGLITPPAIAIGSTAENVANGAFLYMIDDVVYSKGAVAAGTAVGTGYDISDTKYGGIAVYIDTAGTISFQYPAAVQAYASAALAMAALEALTAASGTCLIGYVLIYNNTGAVWDSQTDDLTDASDVTTADFTDAPMTWTTLKTYALTATDITNQNFAFSLTAPIEYVRVVLSAVTGDGKFNIYYDGGQ